MTEEGAKSLPAQSSLWRKLLLILTPALLVILEYWHPYHFAKSVYVNLLPVADHWYYLHLAQMVLFGLMGVGGFLLTEGLKGVDAIISRIGFWLFLVFYTAFDAIAGISVGSIIRYARTLPESDQSVIADIVQKLYFDPISGGSHSWISETASWGWLMGTWAAALALYRAGASKIAALLLLPSGFYIYMSHAYPRGPIGFGCFLVAMLFLLFPWRGKTKAEETQI